MLAAELHVRVSLLVVAAALVALSAGGVASGAVHLEHGAVVDQRPVLLAENGDAYVVGEPGELATHLEDAHLQQPIVGDGRHWWTARALPWDHGLPLQEELVRLTAAPPRLETTALPTRTPYLGRRSDRVVATDGTWLFLEGDGVPLRVDLATGELLRLHVPGRPELHVRGAAGWPHRVLLATRRHDGAWERSLLRWRADAGEADGCWEEVALGRGGRSPRLAVDRHEIAVADADGPTGGEILRIDPDTLAVFEHLALPGPGEQVVYLAHDATRTWLQRSRWRETTGLWWRDRWEPRSPWRLAAEVPPGFVAIGDDGANAWLARLGIDSGERLAWLVKDEAASADGPTALRDAGRLRRPRPLLGIARALGKAAHGAQVAAYLPPVFTYKALGAAHHALSDGASEPAPGAVPETPPAARADAVAPGDVDAALALVLEDERRALARHVAAIDAHGFRRPFSRLRESRKRRIDALEDVLRDRGGQVAEGDDRGAWAEADLEVSPSPKEACEAARREETASVELHDRFLEWMAPGRARRTLSGLRAESVERHVPALRRCAGAR